MLSVHAGPAKTSCLPHRKHRVVLPSTHGIVNVQLAELSVMLGETAGRHVQGYMIRRNEGLFLATRKNGRRVFAVQTDPGRDWV